MVSEIPSESKLSSDECLDEDVDDPCIPNISDVKCILDLRLGSTDSHLSFISCGNNLLIIFVVLKQRVPLFIKLKS
jgi:hypothetical protein